MNKSDLSDKDVAVLRSLPMVECMKYWQMAHEVGERAGPEQFNLVVRSLVLADLFYLLVVVCGRKDMVHPWVYARVREVEAQADGYIDLWFREGYKSTIKTFGKTIQRILQDPDITFGFFSHTRPIAKAFLRQIMREFESNKLLHAAFPDVLWGINTKESPKWSEDDGIIVKRSSNPSEATIEAWGLVDGQPTSKHFRILNFDDVVTDKSVTTPEMIAKTTDALSLAYNLGARGGEIWFTGTYYHFADTYREVVKRGTAKPRIYAATHDGTEYGKPVLLTQKQLDKKRADLGPYIFGCQMLLNPVADALQGFKREWIRYYKTMTPAMMRKMNIYILVDAANAKRKESDYTAIWVVGLNTDKNYYALDITRDRLNLNERTDRVINIHRRFAGMGCNIVQVRYERYGLMADIEHIKSAQEQENYRFHITEVAGRSPKDDRIRRLLGIFEPGLFYLPENHFKTDYEKIHRDLVQSFIEEEYLPFPMSGHKDMCDSLSRLLEPDLPLIWPQPQRISHDETNWRPTVAAYAT